MVMATLKDWPADPRLARGRPVEFLCLEHCFGKYNFAQVTHCEDHRNHLSRWRGTYPNGEG